MAKKQIIIGVIVVAVLAVAGGMFWYARKYQRVSIKGQSAEQQGEQNQNNDSQTGADNEELNTEGWQTYRNEEYGFAVKYPKEWNIYKKEDYVNNSRFANLYIKKENIDFYINIKNLLKDEFPICSGVSESPDGISILFKLVSINKYQNFESILQNCNKYSENNNCKASKYVVDGKQLFLIDSWDTLCGYPTAYYFSNDKLYILSPTWSNQVSAEKQKQYYDLFYTILKTIKFK